MNKLRDSRKKISSTASPQIKRKHEKYAPATRKPRSRKSTGDKDSMLIASDSESTELANKTMPLTNEIENGSAL
jgi:hypothetical protein